jgi:hypothetical protein
MQGLWRRAVLQALNEWIDRRRQIRRRWQADVRRLVAQDAAGPYYEAQRRAARARAQGDRGEFLLWAKAAAEIARIAPNAEIDISIVKRIVYEELRT